MMNFLGGKEGNGIKNYFPEEGLLELNMIVIFT